MTDSDKRPARGPVRLTGMDQRVSIVTFGVPDLDAARQFYVDGLGWQPMLDVPGEVVFIQVGHGLLLALFDAAAMADDIGGDAPVAGAAGVNVAHNLASDAAVVEFVDRARAAGATILKEPQRAAFGGFHAYFADPGGFRWEVAHNPHWRIAPDGQVSLTPTEGS